MNHRKTRRAIIAAVVLAAVAGVAFKYHDLFWQSVRSLRNVELRWLPVALFAATASVFAAARIHRRLLISIGERVGMRPMAAITYAGNAISVSIPVAGTELSAAFTYGQFREQGIAAGKAAWTITLGGITSALTLGALAIFGALVSDNGAAVATGAGGALVSAAVLGSVIASIRNDRARHQLSRLATGVLHRLQRVTHWPPGEPGPLVDKALRQAADLRLSVRQWGLVLILALWNWVADILCFAICIHSVGADVPWAGLILVYCAGAGANSLGLVPGGIGLVEVTLAAALNRAGIHGAQALSAVLVYRIISFWIVATAGWIAYLVLRNRGNDNAEEPTNE